jgi:hypothetical protein
MIFFPAVLFGALLGALRARSRGGNGFDIAQYALVHAIVFAILGLFLTIILHRMG